MVISLVVSYLPGLIVLSDELSDELRYSKSNKLLYPLAFCSCGKALPSLVYVRLPPGSYPLVLALYAC